MRSGASVVRLLGNVTPSTIMMAQGMFCSGQQAPASCSGQHIQGHARPMLRPYRVAPGLAAHSTQQRRLVTEPVICTASTGVAHHGQARRHRRRQARGSLDCRSVTAQPAQPEEVEPLALSWLPLGQSICCGCWPHHSSKLAAEAVCLQLHRCSVSVRAVLA